MYKESQSPVFNFNPTKSFTDYGFLVPVGEDERDLYEQKLAEQMGAAERLKRDAETAAQDSSCPALLRIPLCLIWLRVQDYHLL